MQRHFDLKGVKRARHHLGRLERVAAEIKEIFMNAHLRETENFAPDSRERFFGLRARRDERRR